MKENMQKPYIVLMNTETLLSPDLYAAAYEDVPEVRRRKTDRFRQEKDRRRSLAAGILLSHVLRTEAGADEGDLLTGEHGKPYLPDGSFFFSLSHSGCWAACAAAGAEIGADVETTASLSEAMVKRIFTERERAWMADRRDGWLTEDMAGICLWTVKESYLKMKGTGITVEPRLVEALPEGEEFLFHVTCGGPLETGWALTRWHEGVPVSLCMRNRPPEPAIRVLMPEDCLRT